MHRWKSTVSHTRRNNIENIKNSSCHYELYFWLSPPNFCCNFSSFRLVGLSNFPTVHKSWISLEKCGNWTLFVSWYIWENGHFHMKEKSLIYRSRLHFQTKSNLKILRKHFLEQVNRCPMRHSDLKLVHGRWNNKSAENQFSRNS